MNLGPKFHAPVTVTDSLSVDLTITPAQELTATVDATGVDHGLLQGLTDDDHTQYLLLAGRSGGQTANGGTAAGDDLTLSSTANATKGTIFLGTASAYDQANDRLGIGTTTPAHKVNIVGGTLGSIEAFATTATLGDSSGSAAASIRITTTGSTGDRRGTHITLLSGYTGSGRTTGVEIGSDVAGTGSSVAGLQANFGFSGSVTGTTTGSNCGAYANSENGNENVGHFGRATADKASAVNIGVLGHGHNDAAGGVMVGGYFSLAGNMDDTWNQSAALIADNFTTTAPIFVAHDNNTEVFRIEDGGTLEAQQEFTIYDGIAVEGKGVPAIHDIVSLTGQNASIGSTNFTNGGVAGLYRLGFYLVCTTADVTAGTISASFTYNDGTAARTLTSVGVALISTANKTTLYTNTDIDGSLIRLGSGNIAYSTTLTGSAGVAQYALYVALERLS